MCVFFMTVIRSHTVVQEASPSVQFVEKEEGQIGDVFHKL